MRIPVVPCLYMSETSGSGTLGRVSIVREFPEFDGEFRADSASARLSIRSEVRV